jgi:ankyrin repeat protein
VGFDEIVELLLANGADLNAKDDDGKTTLDWVSSRGKMANFLRKHGGKTGDKIAAERRAQSLPFP